MHAPALPLEACPHPDCGAPLSGLGRYCHACGRYTDIRGPKPVPAAAIPDTRSEEEIEAACMVALETLGFAVYKLSQSRASQQTPGLADLYVAGGGVLAWVEMKRPGRKQSVEQVEFERHVRANGGRYCLWTSEVDAVAFAASVMGRTMSEEGAHG